MFSCAGQSIIFPVKLPMVPESLAQGAAQGKQLAIWSVGFRTMPDVLMKTDGFKVSSTNSAVL